MALGMKSALRHRKERLLFPDCSHAKRVLAAISKSRGIRCAGGSGGVVRTNLSLHVFGRVVALRAGAVRLCGEMPTQANAGIEWATRRRRRLHPWKCAATCSSVPSLAP